LDITVDWRGFELHPETPQGGMRLSDLFPGRQAQAMHEHLRQFAAGFGITDMGSPEWLPNTRRALAIAELARDEGKLDAWRVAAMNAHWRLGKNIQDVADLRETATQIGLDPERAARAMDEQRYLDRVDAVRQEAGDMGVTGVPTFVFGDFAVVGCQPYDVLAEAARRAGAGWRGPIGLV
jgi:predicted DsbA family dithiol-disulfide isomerase